MAGLPPTHPTLSDPAFPHGRTRGYQRGCKKDSGCPASPTCTEANTATKHERERRRAMGITAATDHVPSAPTLAAVDALLAEHTYKQVADMAALTTRSLVRLHGERPRWVLRATEHALIFARERAVAPKPRRVPLERFLQRVHSLAALGYPPVWVAERLGAKPGNRFSWRDGQRWVSAENWERLDVLYRRIEDTPADPARDGIRPVSALRARRLAARRGWLTPIHYDDDGRLPECPGGPGPALAEAACLAKIRGLRAMVNLRCSEREAVRRHPGVTERTLARARAEIGLRLLYDPCLDRTSVAAGSERVAALLREAGARVDLMEAAAPVWEWLVGAAAATDATADAA